MQKIFSSPFAISALVIVWILTALALRDLLPWFFWVTMIALPAMVLAHTEYEFFGSRRGRQILIMCGALLVVHTGWALVRAHYYEPAVPETYWKDDHAYYNEAAALAATWSEGNYPDFWRKGAPPYLGTLHIGYHRPLSALFLIFGPSALAGLALNVICLSIFPLLTALIARYVFELNQNVQGASKHRDPVLLAALLTAIHPNQFYWASFLMKDVYVAFVFLVSLVLILGAWHRKDLPCALASAVLLPYLFTIRIYTALSVIAGTACLPLFRMRTRTVIFLSCAGVVLVIILCSYTVRGFQLYRQMVASFVALAPAGIDSPVDIFKQIGAGIPRLFLAPYAWLRLPTPNPMYGLYPGMWYLYLVGYPLSFAGLHAALKRNTISAVIPIAAFGLAALLFLTATYEGNASRQRYYLEYVVLIFAAYGLTYPNKWWIAGILIAEAAFAVGQVLALQ